MHKKQEVFLTDSPVFSSQFTNRKVSQNNLVISRRLRYNEPTTKEKMEVLMNRKRILSILLVLILLLSACSAATPDPTAIPGDATDAAVIQESPGETRPEESSAPSEETTAPQPAEEATVPQSDETHPAQTEPDATQPTQAPTEAPTEPEQTDAPTEAPTEPSSEPAPSGSDAIIDAAYELAQGEYLDGTHTLTGTISSIVTAYSSRYDNITILIRVPGRESKPIQCFRLKGNGIQVLAVGDTVTVSGKLLNYGGTIEFDYGCTLVSYVSTNPTEPEETDPPATWNDDSRDAVASYIHTYGCLPSFYVTKSDASRLYGWSGGSLDQYASGKAIGGDRFGNYEGLLPDASGRYWTECDIGTIGTSGRGTKRIVFSNDGLIYYTGDHYSSFTLLYGEP